MFPAEVNPRCSTVTCAVVESPARLVTVRVNVVSAVRAPVLFPLPPLVTVPMLWSTVPVEPEKTAVKVALPPGFTAAGLAEKLVIDGRDTTVTVTCFDTEPFNVRV
jgi:hypothetical protein